MLATGAGPAYEVPSVVERCMLQVFRLQHELETARSISLQHLIMDAAVDGDEGEGEGEESDEGMRCALRSLLPYNSSETLSSLLRRGRIEEAITLLKRCVRAHLQIDAAASLKSIPLTAPVVAIERWVKEGLLPRIQLDGAWDDVSSVDPLLAATAIARALVGRAKETEETLAAPAAALALVQLALDVSSFVPSSAADYLSLLQEMRMLQKNLLMQKELWEKWHDKLSLCDVMELELEGLVFDRIDTTAEAALIADLESKVRPLVSEFGGDLDLMLMKWIEETTATKIVVAKCAKSAAPAGCNGYYEDAMDESETCTLTRLVTVASAIKDKSVLAAMVLKLFQMPVFEDLDHLSSAWTDLRDDDDDDEVDGDERRAQQGEESAANSLIHRNAMEQLCALAATVLEYVNASTRDALAEAVSLIKVKALAARYGISRFDPRDSQQVKSAVAIIAGHVAEAAALSDAFEFARKWGGSLLDINAVMHRALTLRAGNEELFCADAAAYEANLVGALRDITSHARRGGHHSPPLSSSSAGASLPAGAASCEADAGAAQTVSAPAGGGTALRAEFVLQDTVSYLLLELEDACDCIEYRPRSTSEAEAVAAKETASAPNQLRAQMLLRGATIICSHAMDSAKDANGGSDDCRSSVRGRTAFASGLCGGFNGRTSPLNGALLGALKRLATLQSRYDLYLSRADLENRDVCHSVVASLAKSRVEWVVGRRAIDSSAGCADRAPLDARCRKLCTLLGVCPMYFAHTSMKLLVEASQLVSMCCPPVHRVSSPSSFLRYCCPLI